MIANANCPSDDKVHFEYFLFFVKDNVFVWVVPKKSGLKAESHIIQKLGVFLLLRVEENAKVVENVVK